MITLNTNLGSMIVQSNLTSSTNALNTAIERMTTGFKINHAKDNAANYSISTNLASKLSSYGVAQDNVSMGLDMLTTAEDHLSLISNHLTRVRDLAEQAANGTYGKDSLAAINREVNSLVDEINRIYSTAKYNGISLFDKTNGAGANMSTIVKEAADGEFINEVKRRDTSNMVQLSTIDVNATLTQGTYSISTPEELAKLATMVNAGRVSKNTEFVLAADIDLSAYSNWTPIGRQGSGFYEGKFDGNGYVIRNLKSTQLSHAGLFGQVGEAEITNLGIENADVTAAEYAGILIGSQFYGITNPDPSYHKAIIDNCYATGKVRGGLSIGGLIGESTVLVTEVKNCYSNTTVEGYSAGFNTESEIGGLIGHFNGDMSGCYSLGTVNCDAGTYGSGGLVGALRNGTITNSFSAANVTGSTLIGGLTGGVDSGVISNCYASGNVTINASKVNIGHAGGISGTVLGTIKNCTSYSKVTSTAAGDISLSAITSNLYDGWYLDAVVENCLYDSSINPGVEGVYGNMAQIDIKNLVDINSPDKALNLQVGITGDASSTISMQTIFEISGIEYLRGIGIQDGNFLEAIDELLRQVNSKQTEYGAAYNRLESALESIGVSIDNLTSTQSTIRDADIAEVSSEYIKMQILQQASATLLATANQTPSIALQLL